MLQFSLLYTYVHSVQVHEHDEWTKIVRLNCWVYYHLEDLYSFWNITPCSALNFNRRFGRWCRLHLQGVAICEALSSWRMMKLDSLVQPIEEHKHEKINSPVSINGVLFSEQCEDMKTRSPGLSVSLRTVPTLHIRRRPCKMCVQWDPLSLRPTTGCFLSNERTPSGV
jgi:hypothetical protein